MKDLNSVITEIKRRRNRSSRILSHNIGGDYRYIEKGALNTYCEILDMLEGIETAKPAHTERRTATITIEGIDVTVSGEMSEGELIDYTITTDGDIYNLLEAQQLSPVNIIDEILALAYEAMMERRMK